MNQKLLFFILAIGFSFSIKAQLSDLHYLPPMKQGQNNAGIREQAVYLSTPEPTSFAVNAYRGTSTTPVATFNISNVSPAVYSMSNGDNNIILVNNANTGIVLNNSGLRFESPSGNRFYVNYRGSSSAQSASLTSKGRVAMGTRFKWGGVPNRGSHPSKSNTLGIMATEDNTTIDLFGYDPGCEFRVGNDRAGITANSHQITLNANESFVYETYIGNTPTQAHEDGWIGSSIVSDKNIVISNGSMNFGRQVGATNRDAGIDQPVPENRLGKEYVFVRGNGNANGWTEFPLLIAIADNTQIFVNGSATPIATIDNGEFFEIPSNLYSSNSVGANMLVQTSKDVYAYQCMAGASTPYTQGLNFVAPVNCLLPDVMDNIPDIRNMAGTTVSGGLTIIAAVNTPDANISVNDGNGAVTLPASNPVAGSTDWKTFYIPNLNGDVSVQSTGPMAVGFFGYNGARGVAGYFSGFDTVPEVTLEIRGGTGCFVGSEIYEATGNFDAYQWYEDGVLIPGANSPSYAPPGAGDFFVRGTKGPCTYDSQSITALYCDPDVVVEKTVDKPEIMEGETATFTIKVRNLGIGPLTNLQITDNIPAGLSLVSNFTITGNWSGNTWDIGTLNGGETAFLELEVQADEIDTLPLLSLTNTAINSQDQIDANTTPDTPSARIVVHNDYDNDGVRDITDLDDDNDGIYDTDECDNLSFNISGGTSHNTSLISVQNYLILDIFSLDNSFNLQINGTDVAGEIQFQASPGNFARFFDGSGYGENGNPQIYTLSGSTGTPLLRVVIDGDGNFELFGSRTSNGALEPMVLTTPPSAFAWDPSGNNTIAIRQDVVGPTNMSGILLTAGCDTDADGIPDQLDLDSDGDGCSDANEYYKDNNADGSDGGEYGTGVPVVNSTDGTVNAASYTQVFAPVITLGNTTEDLGGTDINGDNVSLGQTIEYVLRFQNTGDDNATNYVIRNELPNNITVDNIDITNVLPGTVVNHDVSNGIITFEIPDNLVEVGDPEYTIRITVTIDLNCSSFIDACSSLLENRAYSTYQGVLNTTVFSDEIGGTTATPCTTTPEVARNSIFDDLANCSQSRTVQLCGDNVILSAGSGFTTYTWAVDNNNNGQIDGADTIMNDGDPDNDSSTLLVTSVGNYIVEKISNGTCPDLSERITVERFGTTQTNPIVDYFNLVNGDTNPSNNIQGEILTDCTDGTTQFPEIFLCGATDTALLQMNISDGQLFWEKLDETSCTAQPDNCLNRNLTCTWNQVGTGSDYTVDTSGKYRLSITYLNGCVSRFYFNVFKNDLAIDYNSSDILCTTPGNIRITNIGAGYGFQLINATNNNIVVPFSANNGPNFDINDNGTYKIQITQLNPSDNTPIAGSCIFETDDIGIEEQLFDVALSTTPADCNQLGTISVAALNALPNYSYALFLDDGSNGGQGSPAGNQLAVNENTHTFLNVNPGEYIVVTSTQDGCSESRDITVDEIPELKLGAITSENITCTPGIVNLSPEGGLPSPNYQMAIWSIDGVTAYTDVNSVPGSEFQTTASFLFGDTGNPNREGDYVFIVKDGNGCDALSNSVRVEDLGTITISASDSEIVCADSSTASLTVTASGGNAPYKYSLDGGTNYQNTDTFFNLSAGIYTITVMDSSGATGTGCVENFDYEIVQPFRLTASATIIEDASCNPAGALVKIINANGGQAPYEYSINSGTFSSVNTTNLLPGNHQFTIKDALGCEYDMELTVPSVAADPSFNNNVDYACDGQGTITITPSNTSDFTYSYALNGTANSPTDNNIFTNVAPGTQSITVGYSTSITASQTTLFFENFGVGPTTQIGEVGPGYCYEPQDGNTTTCNLGPAGILVDGEYAVTNNVTNPIPAYRNPNDHSAIANGRFFAINPSNNLVGSNSIVWERKNIEVLPNRDIDISFWAYNLRQTGSAGNNPEILIELIDGTGTVINSAVLAEIPKNNNADDWHNRTVTFNPGANTNVDIVLRSNQGGDDGNELILDDIQAIQLPEICEKTATITVVVEDDQVFLASILGTTDPSCNGASDGAIRFEVSNFDAATGFEYSTDGTNWTTSLVSPLITTANLADGTYNLEVRRINDTACSVNFSATLNEPTVISPTLTQTADFTCFNTGGTLEASATGGSPGYSYQLEDTSTNIVAIFQTSSTFPNITDGDYFVRVRDQKGCEVVSTVPVNITEPETIDFDLTATACYDNLNNASVTATVNTGNGTYQFRINRGPWRTPATATDVTYTFNGLSNGSYDVEVTDVYGCISTLESITIQPNLNATVDVVDISSCADGSITVNATGGDGNFVYAFMPTGIVPVLADFGTSNTFTVTTGNDGDYDVHVWDNNGIDPHCQFMVTETIEPAVSLAYTATPTAPECHDGSGSISVNITAGNAPYTIELIDLDNGGASDQTNTNVVATTQNYFNLGVGNYTVIVTDANGCDRTETPVTITNPDELTADIAPILPPNCDPDPNLYGFEFDNYPLTLGTLEFSADGGSNWQAGDTFVGASYVSGTEVEPSIRVIGTNCQTDFPRYTIPYPLDDLGIDLSAIVVDCNDLQVNVQGTRGSAPYQYTYTDNPVGFDPNDVTTVWTAATPGDHTFTGLVPGRTYVFYVRDSSPCVRQSSVNVNDLAPPPIQIDGVVIPTCDGVANGQVTYTVTETTIGELGGTFDWDFYKVANTSAFPPTLITSGTVATFTSGDTFVVPTPASLAAGDYYVEISSAAPNNCAIGSENLRLEQLDPITFTPNVLSHITCANPGLVEIQNPQGGGGIYTYTLSSTNFIADIVVTNTLIEVPISNLVDVTATPFNVLVEIADQYNCPVTTLPSHTVAMDISQSPTISSVTTSNCATPFGITVNASGGSGPYLYSIDGGTSYVNNGGIFNNVAVGSYAISILDANGCTATDTAEIYPTLQASAVQTKTLDCTVVSGTNPFGPNAVITIEATNGSGSYDYEITGPANEARTTLSTPEEWATSLPGTYTVLVYDNNRPTCPARSFTVEISDAIAPDFTYDPTDVTCFGNSDGSISISEVNNGNNPLSYVLNPNISPFNTTTNSFENLPQGTYEITATGPNGCATTYSNIPVNEPIDITFALPTVTPFGCSSGNTTNNATLAINTGSIIGGTGAYVRFEFEDDASGTILQNGTDANYMYTDYSGGDVIVRIYDDKGCTGEVTVPVPAYDSLNTATVHIDEAISCVNLGEDINIDVSGSLSSYTSNPGNYEFRMLPSGIAQASNQFTDLQPGSYTFAVRNVNTDCEIIVNHIIADPNTFDLVVEKLSDVICFGDDGSIRLTISDATYSSGFAWSIYDTNGTPTDRSDDGSAIVTGSSANLGPTATINVAAGSYLVEVTQDAFPNCGQVRSFTMSAPSAPITLNPVSLTDVGCSNNQGSASISPIGGQAPYDITLTHNPTGTSTTIPDVNSHLFSNLVAGQYTISITDALGCPTTFANAFELLVPDAISGSISSTQLVCQGDTDATISFSLNPRNVSSNYRYVLNSFDDVSGSTTLSSSAPQNGQTFNNLSSGFYNVTVLDDMGCEYNSEVIEIIEPAQSTGMLISTQTLTCLSGAELELRATGGTAPYMWSSDGISFNVMNEINGSNTHLFQNVSAGPYQYYIQDSFNCISIISNEITVNTIEDLEITLDTSAARINCTGDSTALIFATADGGLGDYQYGLFADQGLTTEIRPYQSSGTFANLPQGTYYVSVESEDCQTTSEVVTIDEPSPLLVTPTIMDITCNGANDGRIELDVQGATGDYQYAISPNLNQFDDEGSFYDLAPGDYTVIAQDSNGCFDIVEFTITEPEVLGMALSSTPEICAGDEDGTIALTVNGGTAPYSTSINSNNDEDFVEGRLTFDSLAGDTYLVFVKDAMGCIINQTIVVDNGANLTATTEVVYECTGNTPTNRVIVSLEDDSIAADVLYGLDTDDPNQLVLESSFENITPGVHFITIAHANGCINTLEFEIEQFESLELAAVQQNLNEITAVATGGKEGYTFYFDGVDNGNKNTFFISRTDTYSVRVVDENGCETTTSIFMEFIDIEIPNFFTPDGDGQNDLWLPRNIEQFPQIWINVFDRYGRLVYRLEDSPQGWDGLYQENTLPTGDYWYIIKLNGAEDIREFVGHFTLYR